MHGSTPGHRSSPAATLGEGELLRLGEWVRDVSLTLGGGYLTDPLEAILFHEALTDAIDTLSARQSMREAMQKHSTLNTEGGSRCGPIFFHCSDDNLAKAR